MARIKALDADVVHKIAAGEIIVRPSNAIKELIENSIDAKATRIDIVVKEGGLKLLQITDNGHGIDVEDLPILCQRFTTSKLTEAEDLDSISTLGFRGEALASISYVSHLTVKTKTNDARVATQANFLAGEMVEGTQKRLAGVNGTQISVMDLFYNSRHRLEVFDKKKSRTEEYHRILETVQKYAILYSHVAFSVKRVEDTQPVVITGKTAQDRIRSIYELRTQDLLALSVDAGDDAAAIGLKSVSGYATGLNFSKKSADSLVLFINNRLVTCGKLSSAIRNVYSRLLPSGSLHYLVYLNLQIAPENVDVNVHPTKREVKVLFQDDINQMIAQHLEEVLTRTGDRRDYRVQSYIASTTLPSDNVSSSSSLTLLGTTSLAGQQPSSRSSGVSQARYEYNLVRTDPSQQTLTPFVQSSANKTAARHTPRMSPIKKQAKAADISESEDTDQSKDTVENEDSDENHEKENADANDYSNEIDDPDESGSIGGNMKGVRSTKSIQNTSDIDDAISEDISDTNVSERNGKNACNDNDNDDDDDDDDDEVDDEVDSDAVDGDLDDEVDDKIDDISRKNDISEGTPGTSRRTARRNAKRSVESEVEVGSLEAEEDLEEDLMLDSDDDTGLARSPTRSQTRKVPDIAAFARQVPSSSVTPGSETPQDEYSRSESPEAGAQSSDLPLKLSQAESLPAEPPRTPRKGSPARQHESPIKSMKSYQDFKVVNLQSVDTLIEEVKAQASPGLLRLISEHSFVGVVDSKRGLAAIQWDVRLYLVDYMELFFQMFYQIGLTQFANFGTIHLGDGLPLKQVLAIQLQESDQPVTEEDTDTLIARMTDMLPMLQDYFQIDLAFRNDEWVLLQLPLLLPEYTPSASRLPQFVADLLHADWDHEKECIEGIVRALAALYVPSNTVTRSEVFQLFERAKFGFVPTRALRQSVTEIANLPGLYRVFERC